MATYLLTCESVLRAWDSGMDVYTVAAKYEVSRACVHRLVQRRIGGGDRAAEANQVSAHVSAHEEDRLVALVTALPDATLAERRDTLPTTRR